MPNKPRTHKPYRGGSMPSSRGRAEARRIRGTYRWQKVRRLVMRERPLCEGCGMPAQQVHHIKPLHTHPELAFDDDNLSPVCTSCHSLIENGHDVELMRGRGEV